MNAYIQKVTEGRIDFEGQKKVDDLVRYTLIASTVVSFILGFALQSLSITFGSLGVLTIALCLIVIPPWPMFNRHPVQWLSPKAKKE